MLRLELARRGGRRTDKILLGTGVTCPILRYHPSVIAQAAATLACLAPQRFYLGVGTGEALNEYSSTARWPGYKTRQEQMAEAIELIRALWTGGEITYEGAHYQTRQAKLYTYRASPFRSTSLHWYRERSFRREHGDGLITVGVRTRIRIVKFSKGSRRCARGGKDPSRMPR